MGVKTESKYETRYLLEHALRTRGYAPTIDGLTYTVLKPDEYKFSLTFLPGNRRVLISHSVWVNPTMRGKGLGRKLLRLREEIAQEAGINLMLATVRNENVVQIHLLESSGWKKLLDRPETGVALWSKQL